MTNSELKKSISAIAEFKDKISFGVIFDYFAPRIIGYLMSTGTKQDIAEEITQEVLTTVWQKSSQFNHEKGNVSTWIFTIARNKRIDRLRKNENPLYNSDDFINALYQIEDSEDLASGEKILKLISKLNNYDQKLVKMSFFEGKSHNIISRDLEIPLGTVKSRIRNILLKMKKL